MALRKRNILFTATLLALFVGMAAAAINIINDEVRTPAESLDIDGYKVSGIDVSAHNGTVDFEKAHASGVDFVFIKATEGATFRDSLFMRNLKAANAAGIAAGAYHFFRFDVDGEKQAQNLLKAIAGQPITLPLVIDVETESNPYQPTDRVTRKVHDMVDVLTSYGYPVAIYSNKKGLDRHIRDEFSDCGVWICSFTQPDKNAAWTFWQYSHKGSIPGIDGDVDLDLWHGTEEQWKNYTDSTSHAISIANALYSTINSQQSR